MEEDPSKNPLEGAKLPADFSVSDFEDAETHPDVRGKESMSADISPDLEGLTSEVDIKSMLGAINDYALGIMHGLRGDPRVDDLPAEASAAVEFLHFTVANSAVNNDPDAIMGLSCELAVREGTMFEYALDYPPGDEIDQEKYITVLENFTSVVELISTWQLLQDQLKDIPETLYHRLSGNIAAMQCDELAEIIGGYVTEEM